MSALLSAAYYFYVIDSYIIYHWYNEYSLLPKQIEICDNLMLFILLSKIGAVAYTTTIVLQSDLYCPRLYYSRFLRPKFGTPNLYDLQ